MPDNVNTYNGLVESIINWTNRNDTDFAANVPLFITLAEQQFFIDCSTLGNESYVTGSFNANNESVPKPELWGQTLTFSYIDSLGSIVVLKRATYEFIRSLAPTNNMLPPSTLPITTLPVIQQPQYYSDYGYNYFIVSPTPQAASTYEIAYFQKVQPLSPTNQVNWITQYAYDALFWACLDKAYRYIDNSAAADMYMQKYQDRVQALVQYDKGRRWDRTADGTKG